MDHTKPIVHAGVLGMKWGVRKQYSFASKKHRKAAESNAEALAKMSGRRIKDPKKMTDDELHKKLSFLIKYYNKPAPSEVAIRAATLFAASYAMYKLPDVLNFVAWNTGKIVSTSPLK